MLIVLHVATYKILNLIKSKPFNLRKNERKTFFIFPDNVHNRLRKVHHA